MAMVIPFPGNSGSLKVEYHKKYNHFICLYKNTSQGFNTPLDLWRVLGTAKYTDSGKALKQWALEVYKDKVEVEAREDTSFASDKEDSPPPMII